MSLINKMLQDLEARQEAATPGNTQVYQDLRSVGTNGHRSAWRLAAVVACVLGLGAAVYFAAGRMGIALVSSTVVAAAPTKAPGATAVAQSQTAAAPVAAPIPAPVVREAPKPAAPATDKPGPELVATAAAVTVAAEPKPAVVGSPPVSRGLSDSQNKAQVSIVKPVGSAPAAAKKAQHKAPAAPPRKSAEVVAQAAEPLAVVDKKVRPLTAGEKAEAKYRSAVRFLDQGRAEDAMGQLREALREQAGHVKARELAAGLALQSGHWREAENLLEEGLRQVPSHYLFAQMLARVYVDHGAEAKALTVMESAAPQGSDDPDFSSLLGLLYQRAGRHADAVEVYKRALALRPTDSRTWIGFAISLEGTEQWAAAKSAYQRAKEVGGLTPPLAQYADQRLAALSEH